jgi:transcriptional regulator with XRE-family HTH domain
MIVLMRPRQARTTITRRGSARARRLRERVALDVRTAREDAGLSLRRLARAAGVSHATLASIERAAHDPTTEVLARVGEALGMDLAVRLYPGTGPHLRDHHQAAMLEALLRELHPRWRSAPEVWVTEPARGVIDLELTPDRGNEPLVAVEAESELRRLERQVRWAGAKARALADLRGRPTSRLLLLRCTRANRSAVAAHQETVASAYPAPIAATLAALRGEARWTGSALLWADTAAGRARIRSTPPRGITIGRRAWQDDHGTTPPHPEPPGG